MKRREPAGMMLYLWIKALHIMAVIAWMAGLFYLPRLYVYHVGAAVGSDRSETFKIMEDKLLRVIMNPAMIVAWLSGLYIAWAGGFLMAGWFHGKLAGVLAMSGFHGFLAAERRRFAADGRARSEKFYRIINEVPTLLMVAIVLLVVLKP